MAVTFVALSYIVVLLFVRFVLGKAVSLWRRRQELQKLLKDFPGPDAHWWHGNTREFTGDYAGLKTTVEYAKTYPGAVPMWTGPFDCTLLALHPSAARAMFSGTDPKDEFSYSLLKGWMGDGLLLSKGRKWDRTRRLLTPAFSVDILRNYVNTFRATSSGLIAKWRGLQNPVEVFHHTSLLTMDSMLRCLFGHVSHCQQEKKRHPYIQGVYTLSDLIVQRIVNPLHHWDTIYKMSANGKKFYATCDEIHRFSRSLIEDRRRLLASETDKPRPLDFLDILLTAKDSEGRGLTEEEIQDEVDTFMFAGHDSTASALSWCLYNMAAHPEHQEKCREEINGVLNGKSELTWESLGKLHHTTLCLYESMRLFPPVPNLSRYTDRDIGLPDGRVIPKGIRVGLSLFAMHRNPEIWDDPDEFEPERFESEEMASANFFMPFSLGPRTARGPCVQHGPQAVLGVIGLNRFFLRNCIGQHFALTQLKVAVSMVLRNFRLSLVPDRPAEPISLLILRSKDGLYLNLEPL